MKYPLLIVVLMLFHLQVWAATPSLHFEEITLKDGLSQATILDMHQDEQGFMWFATQEGLNRFDGHDFVVYRHDQSDDNSLSDNYVNNVFQDSKGLLWLTTRNGLNRFDPATGEFTHYFYDVHNPNSLSDNWTFGITEAPDGRIWVGTYNSGIAIYDPQNELFTSLTHDLMDQNSLSDNAIYDVFTDSWGTIWVATRNGGVNRYNANNQTFTRFSYNPNDLGSISHNKVYKIFQGSDGTLWFATRGGGLNRFDADTETFIRYRHNANDSNSISGDEIYSIAEDHNGDLLVGTLTKGLNRLSKGSDRFVRIKHNPSVKRSLSGNSILSILVDNAGILWLSIQDIGLNRLNPQSAVFNHYRHIPGDNDSLVDNSVQSLMQTRNGDVYIATRDGGINRFDPQSQQFSLLHQADNPGHQLLTRPASQILEAEDGNLWIAMQDDGLVHFNLRSNEIEQFVHDPENPASLSHNSILQLLPDGKGNLWIATNEGLNLFNPRTKLARFYLHDEYGTGSLPNDWITSLLIDHTGTFWVGTQDGLAQLDPETETFTHFFHDPQDPDSISGDSILNLFEDSHNNLWVSTANGLNKYLREGRRFERIQKAQGLSNAQAYGVLEDEQGYLWIVTNLGLNRYDPTNHTMRLFTGDDGLQSNEFNQGAFYKMLDGRLLFGGVNGFNMFDPAQIKENPYPPSVMLTNFRIINRAVKVGMVDERDDERVFLNRSINFTDKISLTHEDSVFSFDFSALHYAAPSLNQYAYRLVGFDQNWINTDFKNRRATYTNLAAGDYIFEVKGSNKDGIWSEMPATIDITIQFPWWLSTSAKFIWLILIFLAGFGLFQIKTERIRRQREQLQQQVTWQVAQVVAQKKALETSYEDIRIISNVGQKINSSLDMDKVLWAVYEAINKLMDGTVFGIGLYQPKKNLIRVELAMERGRRYKPYFRSMEDKNQFPVWCIENEADVFVNDLEEDGPKYLKHHEYDGYDDDAHRLYLEDHAYSGVPQSLIYVPIKSEDKILGYMTVQSFSKQAYRHVHINILHTLAAYTSTAIVNSRAHQQLLDNKQSQVESEKMASLGALVAGVAHEIDTPVGICMTTASSLEFEADQLFSAKRQGKLTSKMFNQFEDKMNLSLNLLMNNLHKTSGLIANFEGVVVDLATEVKSTFNVKELFARSLQTLQSELNEQNVRMELKCDEHYMATTYTSPLTRVLSTLVMNSLLHAFDDEGGKIIVSVDLVGEELHIRYIDDGKGMDSKLAERIFDPFYTTKRADGCLGLGMHIVFNQVSQGLNGTVSCHSASGEGMQISINMPVRI